MIILFAPLTNEINVSGEFSSGGNFFILPK